MTRAIQSPLVYWSADRTLRASIEPLQDSYIVRFMKKEQFKQSYGYKVMRKATLATLAAARKKARGWTE